MVIKISPRKIFEVGTRLRDPESNRFVIGNFLLSASNKEDAWRKIRELYRAEFPNTPFESVEVTLTNPVVYK